MDNLAFLRGITAPVVAGAVLGAVWWFWIHPVSPSSAAPCRSDHRRCPSSTDSLLQGSSRRWRCSCSTA
ncbi:hypothetical protein PAHAL_6G233600 [Panicum hallii]|uniref:Uncharacterized protein n=1 Tax=Panicum hallii TaxID=206008 RepID=A0A2T8IH95_9POAL|nr:hypothetical protein PAHAL_6G233600 [Panicum hallii]